MRMCLPTLTAVLWIAATAEADWPQFRGPTGQGISSARNVPIEWSNEKNVVWKQAIPGEGWSSPIVFGGRVYLTAAVRDEGSSENLSLQVLALDAFSGQPLWQREVFSEPAGALPGIHSKNSQASPTPLVADDRLYVHFGHLGTACLSLEGALIWRNTELRYQPVHGNGGSPIVAGDGLVFSVDGQSERFVVSLDRRTGEVLWKTQRDEKPAKSFSFCTPLLIQVDGQQQIISPGSGVVAAYDPPDGREIWKVRHDGYSVVPRPVYGHGLVYISTGYDSPVLLAIRPDGEGDVTDTHVAWSLRRGVPLTPSLLLAGDELYLMDDRGVATCLDAASGERHWQQRIAGDYSSSPVLVEDRVYVQTERGKSVVFAAETRYRQLATNELGERTLASFAVTDGALFIRGDKHLYRIGNK
ncbi:MAG: PQQ-binding-like beta-propeller repeat protein [Pirellulales bacterium]